MSRRMEPVTTPSDVKPARSAKGAQVVPVIVFHLPKVDDADFVPDPNGRYSTNYENEIHMQKEQGKVPANCLRMAFQ